MIIKGICEYILFIIKQRHIDNFIKSGNICQRGAEAEVNAMNPAILQQSLELKRLWGSGNRSAGRSVVTSGAKKRRTGIMIHTKGVCP